MLTPTKSKLVELVARAHALMNGANDQSVEPVDPKDFPETGPLQVKVNEDGVLCKVREEWTSQPTYLAYVEHVGGELPLVQVTIIRDDPHARVGQGDKVYKISRHLVGDEPVALGCFLLGMCYTHGMR